MLERACEGICFPPRPSLLTTSTLIFVDSTTQLHFWCTNNQVSNDYGLSPGTEPAPVLVSEVREASATGWTLCSDPQTIIVQPERVIYLTSPDTGRRTLVAVLGPDKRLTPGIARSIAAQLKTSDSEGMVRKVDVVTAMELSRRVGVGPETIKKWRKIPSFPKPFATMGNHQLFDAREVKAWIVERDRWLSPYQRRNTPSS